MLRMTQLRVRSIRTRKMANLWTSRWKPDAPSVQMASRRQVWESQPPTTIWTAISISLKLTSRETRLRFITTLAARILKIQLLLLALAGTRHILAGSPDFLIWTTFAGQTLF